MSFLSAFNPPLPKHKQSMTWSNLTGSSISLAISQFALQCEKPLVIITPDLLTSARLEYELPFFQEGTSIPLVHFPDWETLPYDPLSPHQDIISSRLSALHRIPRLEKGIIIISVSTLMHQLLPRDWLEGNIFLLSIGDPLVIEALRRRLEKAGYRAVEQVREHGEFAVRGAIVDLFPMGSDEPYRIDLLDNEIDSIRTFSTETQRSLDKIDHITLLPAKEFPLNNEAIELFRQNFRSQFSGNPLNCSMYQEISEGIYSPGVEYYFPLFFKNTNTFFEYLPENSIVISMGDIRAKADEFWHEITIRYEQRAHDVRRPVQKPEYLFIEPKNLFRDIKQYAHIQIETSLTKEEKNVYVFPVQQPLDLNIDHKAAEPLHALKNFLANNTHRILFCAETNGRREVLMQLFHSISLYPTVCASWSDFLKNDAQYNITVASLEDGLTIENPPLTVIAETQLFGKRIMQRRRRKETPQDLDAIVKNLTELQIGSPIVHIDHGVGRYLGLQALTIGDHLSEYLCIEYAEAAKLYVPVASLQSISRYTGQDPEHAPLHRLGSEQWSRVKRKAAEQLRDVAAELLDLYAKRAAQKGLAYTELDGQYLGFATAFPFEETPDQLRAINQVMEDMASDKPMDRLICGDVGFGKTEVAMRAAFLSVQNNKQVVMLVPTTLLAQQHFQSFQDRFADWPIQIEMISRFRNSQQQDKAMQGLEDGTIDIVIGTHQLLHKNIRFKSLGLVIIDEEHRFGVKQKEHLKALRANVHVLALTATPIPRTLNMAFAGIRDLSLITTPPARRLSIKTFVYDYEPPIIQEAMLREIMRGGQVYFLHNDVATIEKTARDLEKLIPEARIHFAHGQLPEHQLEQIMADFYHRRFNVLVCTTIIESGIDIPSANTIIINRADKLGLAQLHQLRGRVGRSHHQAYAYLLVPSRQSLTPDATKRLDAISTYEELGLGFTLATHDLEIRGAGELLGKNQSGSMHEMGFTLYMDLLTRAVNALKSGKEPDFDMQSIKETEIELRIPAYIPEDYLADVHLRLQCYKRIASAKSNHALDDIQVEMIDRFGLLPSSAKNLFDLALLKQQCETLGIKKLEATHQSGKITFIEHPPIDPLRILHLIQSQSAQFRLDGGSCLRFTLPKHELNKRLQLIESILKKLH